MRAAGIFAALLCASCGGSSSSTSSNVPPVVDSVDAADTVKSGQVLAVTVKGHDDDDNIVTLKVHLVASQATQDPPAQSNPAPAKQVQLILSLAFVGAPAGTNLEYDVTLVDQGGVESAPVKKNVTIQ
jgi:hypothetical protein